METGKKVVLDIGDKINSNHNGIELSEFEVWTGRNAEEFYDRQKIHATRNPELYD